MDTRASRRSASRTLVETVIAAGKPRPARSQSRGRSSKSSKTPERNRPRSKSKRRKSPGRRRNPPPNVDSQLKSPRETHFNEEKPERESSPLSPTDKLKEEIIRNSVSRFEDITAVAVTSVRKSSRLRANAKKEELEQEVTTLLKENISEISQSKPKSGSISWKDYPHAALLFLLILILPSIPLALLFPCTSSMSCKAELLNLPKTWRKYFALEQSLGYVVFLLLQFIISCIPLGIKSTNVAGSIRDYRCSGLASVLICCGGVSLLRHFFKDEFQSAAEKEVVPLAMASITSALFFSLVLLLMGKTKPDGEKQYKKTTNLIVDFFYGLEVNPRVGPLDFKVIFLRSSLVLCILLNFIYLVKAYDMFGVELPIPFAVICFMQIMYCVDFLIFESSYLTSHMVNHEGTGYMTVMSAAIFPFIALTFTQFSFSAPRLEDFPVNMVPSIVVYIVGHIIVRVSNWQKAALKRNPEAFSYGDVVVGSGETGGKLLCRGLWGLVRHPNYLGSLLVWWGVTWCSAVAVGHLHPAIVAASLSLSFGLLFRVMRIESHLSTRYPLTFARYSSRVPRVLVPFVA